MINKPAHGAPCNRCGKCCEDDQCPLSVKVFGEIGACPALEWEGDRSSCGLVSNPRVYAPVSVARYGAQRMSRGALMLIGSFGHCDGQLEDEPYDYSLRDKMSEYDRVNRSSIADGFKVWRL